MSCITELLKMKEEYHTPDLFKFNEGDDKYTDTILEGGGQYKGFEYCITFTAMGHRCAYVAISKKLQKEKIQQNSEILYECHGGITYYDEPNTNRIKNCNDKWMGFDANYHGDRIDKHSLEKYFNMESRKLLLTKEILEMQIFNERLETRTFHFMEEECKKLIDQIIQ